MNTGFVFGEYDLSEMKKILLKADLDEMLSGFVNPNDLAIVRLPILKDKKLVGFSTPRQDHDGVWRMGALYVLPEYRGQGLARDAILKFMLGKKGRAFIEYANISSQKAYSAAGFKMTREDKIHGGHWWENFKI